jgi:hypothetical protein
VDENNRLKEIIKQLKDEKVRDHAEITKRDMIR